MAGLLSADEIDFGAYMRSTECKAKVRSAAEFADDLISELEPQTDANRSPSMFSTKIRNSIEFRPGEVTVWAGYNGHRKSLFTGQVAAELCKQRVKVLIASMEMEPRRTLARMARQFFGSREIGPTTARRFAEWTDGRLWLFDHVGRVQPDQMLAVLSYFANELGGQQVFIDSMMMVCASEESLDEQKQFMTDLVRSSQETGLHLHLVAHCRKPQDESKPPTKYDLRGSAALSDQAQNVITVWANKPKRAALDKDPNDFEAQKQPDAAVTIEKQRNGNFEGRLAMWFHETSLRFTDERLTPVEAWTLN